MVWLLLWTCYYRIVKSAHCSKTFVRAILLKCSDLKNKTILQINNNSEVSTFALIPVMIQLLYICVYKIKDKKEIISTLKSHLKNPEKVTNCSIK